MTDEERARKLLFPYDIHSANQDTAVLDVAAALAATRAEALEAAAQIAEAQPYYVDTHTGLRQQWVKDEIARKVRALAADPATPKERPPGGGRV